MVVVISGVWLLLVCGFVGGSGGGGGDGGFVVCDGGGGGGVVLLVLGVIGGNWIDIGCRLLRLVGGMGVGLVGGGLFVCGEFCGVVSGWIWVVFRVFGVRWLRVVISVLVVGKCLVGFLVSNWCRMFW